MDPRGVQVCEVGVDSVINPISALQDKTQWCWAATISSIFSFHGFPVDQERIVRATFGRVTNLPAIGPQIAAATSRRWTSEEGEKFEARCEVLLDQQFNVRNPGLLPIVAQELAHSRPLIIGTGGHAMVLSAMTYVRDVIGNGQPTNATVRDPWPGRGRRILHREEWYGTAFLAKVKVSEL